MKLRTPIVAALLMFVGLFSAQAVNAADKPKVDMVTNMGTITLELEPDKAPISVENFLAYVDAGFYNGTIFHRVIENFMIQGGGFSADYKKKAVNAAIQNEADNGLANDFGTIAMARTNAPHSATGQFFINVKDNSFLNHTGKNSRGWGYAVFGRVVAGIDTVNKIRALKTGSAGIFRSDVPKTTVIIESVTRVN